VHLELTGDPVTEAIGGSMNLKEDDLKLNYLTHCDPRLNYEQSMDIAFTIATYFRKNEQ
jgi:3-deoxy-7-phosphoheptulonate synthase